MKNWKEHAHLFANSKFQVIFNDDFHDLVGKGFIGNLNGDMLQLFESKIKPDATLIARPISDMTDEEIKETTYYKEVADFEGIDPIEDFETMDSMNAYGPDMLYLLSIGVYPFDQSDFKTGKVISTLKEYN